ncbi:hypothetical protein O181_007844 [Austropuccinia psidii MF-1]|uniref:Uncharacterized protein n=1 Tax=Austropuccinia psidii MF-1 TaxID=1389203 RepID=A0A9Q3GIA6_9BASI|nr:hypothetical protein [Austropuccinia psidii MF-1]
MATRIGSQYSIQSDGAELRSKINPSKGKRKGKIPSGPESTQGSSISQTQVPEMPIVSEPELELSMSNPKKYKPQSSFSYRHIHEPVQAVLHGVQVQILGNVATNPPRSDELLENSQKVPQTGVNSDIIQWMVSTIIQNSNKKAEDWHNKKREASKEEASVASTSKTQASQPPQEGKKNWREQCSPIYRIPRIQNDAMDNIFKIATTLMEFKEKKEQRMRQPHFPKK